MAQNTGHRETLDDLKMGTLSVNNANAIFLLEEKKLSDVR